MTGKIVNSTIKTRCTRKHIGDFSLRQNDFSYISEGCNGSNFNYIKLKIYSLVGNIKMIW